MSHRVPSAALVLLLLPALAAAQDKKDAKEAENPFKTAKVGDWASYAMTTTAQGMKFEGTTKMVVSAKNDKEVTLKTSASFGGMDLPAQESKIDLTKPYDPTSTAGLPKGFDAKVEKVGEGKEKIKVGGKEYETTWTKMKVSAKVMDKEFTSEVKVWMAKEVPLGGTVKMEMKSDFADMVMELKEFGSEKDKK